jgi:hypothetical protein
MFYLLLSSSSNLSATNILRIGYVLIVTLILKNFLV